MLERPFRWLAAATSLLLIVGTTSARGEVESDCSFCRGDDAASCTADTPLVDGSTATVCVPTRP